MCAPAIHAGALWRSTCSTVLKQTGDPAAASAGLMAWDGASANPTLIDVMADRYRLDLSGHRARRLTEEMGADARMIVVMEAWQRDWILERQPDLAGRIHLLTEFSSRPDEKGADIPDPIERGPEVYAATAHAVLPLVRNLLAYIRSTSARPEV